MVEGTLQQRLKKGFNKDLSNLGDLYPERVSLIDGR